MPLPVRYRPGDRPEHPAARHLRDIDGYHEMIDERMLRRIAAAYFGLITHLDEQVGAVMKVVEELGLLANTRIVYTSDHGELFGWQGMFGKKSLYEGSVGVPLLIAGPSKAGQFMLREGDLKLICHVGMPSQLFDLAADPEEAHDLVEEGRDEGRVKVLEAKLRQICDPEEIDRRAKADQRKMAEFWGGPDKLRGADQILFTPPPGVSSADAWAIPKR